ncbi:hypothetical protein [Alicycliphilus denitrificans]|uniref:hypothetical protein n=1 Tax=Alicycliphilus denitrificans TaxID=179636 RepID=UPI000C9FC734|nr:hypothetical protein [Alicycliphilus denitrificans]
MAVNEQELALVAQLLNTQRMRDADLAAMLGNKPEKFRVITAELQRRVLAKRIKIPYQPGVYWASTEPIIARCTWTPEQVLEHIQAKPCTIGELAAAAKCSPEPMRLMLRRMEYEKLAKVTSINGKGMRRWIPYTQPVTKGGARRPVKRRELLAQIALHQPVRLELLVEIFDRGRIYMRGLVGKARRAGKVRIVQVDGSWLYALADYERPAEDIGREIELRCEDVGGDCLKWSGARNLQGHPLIRHGGNTVRVDKVLWEVVHGKVLREGYTLVTTCETPGCCNHDHHKQVTRSQAMKKAFADIGFGGVVHSRRTFEAMRSRPGVFTAEDVQMIRESTLNARELAEQTGFSKTSINDVRSGRTYKHYGPASQPTSVMGTMVGVLCR